MPWICSALQSSHDAGSGYGWTDQHCGEAEDLGLCACSSRRRVKEEEEVVTSSGHASATLRPEHDHCSELPSRPMIKSPAETNLPASKMTEQTLQFRAMLEYFPIWKFPSQYGPPH